MERFLSVGYHRRIVLRAGAGLAAGIIASPAWSPAWGQAAATPIGSVDEVRGDANAERNGERRGLQARADVFVGDLLVTGDNALLVLKLGPATTIKLGSQAKLRIDRYLAETGGEFDMIAGHLQFERKGKQATDGILFKSAYGLMAVRGTRFYAGPNRGQFAVLVGEGKVEVTGGARSVLLEPQQGIDIKSPGQPPTAPKIWPLPRVREMLANFR